MSCYFHPMGLYRSKGRVKEIAEENHNDQLSKKKKEGVVLLDISNVPSKNEDGIPKLDEEPLYKELREQKRIIETTGALQKEKKKNIEQEQEQEFTSWCMGVDSREEYAADDEMSYEKFLEDDSSGLESDEDDISFEDDENSDDGDLLSMPDLAQYLVENKSWENEDIEGLALDTLTENDVML